MRFILLILLLCSFGADAQMIIKAHANYRPYAQPAANLLLDDYPNAGAAYSLRKLDKDYSGNAIRVRRSNDNAEQDIGFTSSGDLDTASLKTFIGANSAFVTTWYDQSGNSRNCIQNTAANQPRIANLGVIERQNGKVSTFYDGSNDHFTLSDFALPTSSIFSAANNTVSTSSNIHSIYCRGTSNTFLVNRDALLYVWRTNNTIELQRSDNTSFPTATRATTINSFSLYGGIYTGTQLIAYNNGIAGTAVNTTISGVSSNPVSSVGATFELNTNKYHFGGFISEVIVYASNQSSNRTGIENNINDYYNIYWNGDFTGILDTYGSSAAAYSLRNLSSTYLGPLIRVRRSNDNAEQDIFGDYYGNLDTVGLKTFVGSNNGFVTTWYDQSGNARNATQGTAANQARIVNAGVIDRQGTRPTVLFDGSNDNFNITAFSASETYSLYYVQKRNSSGVRGVYLGGNHAQGGPLFVHWSDNNIYLQYFRSTQGYYKSVSDNTSTFNLLEGYVNNTPSHRVYKNNFQLTLGGELTFFGTNQWNSIGLYNSGNAPNGTQSEIILYHLDQLSNRSGIVTNINTYYSIY